MNALLYGAIGAFFMLLTALLGGAVGWLLGRKLFRGSAESPEAEELKRMAAEQAAFHALQNYNAETAYGIGGDALEEGEDI